MHDCIYFDAETGWCRLQTDWSDPMPVIGYCVEGPCMDYKEEGCANDG